MKKIAMTLMMSMACMGMGCFAMPAVAAATGSVVPKAAVDVASLIKQSAAKYQGSFRMPEKQAVAQMDAMLTQQYMAGHITNEKNAYLKSLYYQASGLIMNGHPIAGGTLIALARVQPGFSDSPGGRGMAHFVDAMLQPTDEDPDLAEFMAEANKAKQVLAGLRPELQMVAQLHVIGTIYHDKIAVDAGKAGLQAMKATPAEWETVKKALKVK